MIISNHVRERFVQRIWQMPSNPTYLSEQQGVIDKELDRMLAESIILFKKPHINQFGHESIRAFYFHEDRTCVIVIAENGAENDHAYVTLFRPDLPHIPSRLRTQSVIRELARSLSDEYLKLTEMQSETEEKAASLTVQREVIIQEIEKLERKLDVIDRDIAKVTEPFKRKEVEVMSLGKYFVNEKEEE